MSIRINKVMKELNVGHKNVLDFLHEKGFEVEDNLNAKITTEQYDTLKGHFNDDKTKRQEAKQIQQNRENEKNALKAKKRKEKEEIFHPIASDTKPQLKTVGHVDLDKKNGNVVINNDTNTKKVVPKATPKATPEVIPNATPKVTVTAKQEVKVEDKNATEIKADSIIDKKKSKSSVEERSEKIGSEDNGVFKLKSKVNLTAPKVIGTIDLAALNQSTHPKKKTKEERKKERDDQRKQINDKKKKRTRINKAKVNIQAVSNQNAKKGVANKTTSSSNNKSGSNPNTRSNASGGNTNANNRPRGRFTPNRSGGTSSSSAARGGRSRNNRYTSHPIKTEFTEEEVAKQVKETLARLTNKTKTTSSKYRKVKRNSVRAHKNEQILEENAENKVLKLTEFVTANELASMMDISVTDIIATCMSIGVMVSINQRLDAETINIVAEEFGFKTEYVSAEVVEAIEESEDKEEDLEPRDPVVTVMGHVDHGKTSLLDQIRKADVIAGEAGGITQHIGAYNVTLENGRHITFLDTPGHEAFTAMRARGAQITDVAIIIVAADDDIMPQTKEAINQAMAANVPIVFAINKIDKPGANPEKIKESLANMNFLVEEWGGKYQSQDISAKKGTGVKELLEKVLLEADILELKANSKRKAVGSIIESSLDKGRGYVANILVTNGTLHQGDVVLAGIHYGHVKALFNERNQRIDSVGPAKAAILLGLDGAPQAGDAFHVMDSEQEVRDIANKREQLQREQKLRTSKMLTLDEVGRRIALGSFQELNVIVKGDVDGSVEALSDSLIRLSTEKIAVNVISKAVGQISETDVNMAAASEGVIIGFQVRPSAQARRLADQEGVDIRLYSIIYDAIEEVKKAMEGMLEPVMKEEIASTINVKQVFNITKVGLVAGGFVEHGKVRRSDKAHVIRDGIVVFTGTISALKRFKDDVKEVPTNFECGISLTHCNDLKEGDIIETYQEIEIKQKL